MECWSTSNIVTNLLIIIIPHSDMGEEDIRINASSTTFENVIIDVAIFLHFGHLSLSQLDQ